jgi:NAD(P)-dependent dehydrogenase (short-subunit alcohol dehydrogenase family)
VDLELADRVILVVGATGLIGGAVAGRLDAEGARVVRAARHIDDGIRIDGRDAASVREGIEAVVGGHGRLDGLVVTAAPPAQTLDPSRSSDADEVLDAIDGKAMVFLRLASAAIERMRPRGYGRIVGVSGQNALLTGSIAGSVRNAALNIAAKNLADSVAGTGITVNTVNPGTVTPTPSSEVGPAQPGQSRPEQIADLIAFLLSPRTGAISGESIAMGHRIRGINSL